MTHFANLRGVSLLGAMTLAGALTGCSSMPSFLGGTSRNITFNNVTDSSLNVTYYVRSATPPADWKGTPEEWNATGAFVSDRTFQVDRGETVSYRMPSTGAKATGRAAHIKVQPVSPSWVTTTSEYWLEVLTDPPVSIVATGVTDDVTFNCGTGAVAVIPEREIRDGRFDHRVVNVMTKDHQ